MASFGIMQGRLSKAPDSKDLDWFPLDNWHQEFKLARELGFDTIEIVLDKAKNPDNPVWSNSGRMELFNQFKQYELIPYSACLNFIINYSLSNTEIFKQTCLAIENLNTIGIKYIILPLFGESDLSQKGIHDNLLSLYQKNIANNYELLLETNLPARNLMEILENIGIEGIGLVYDIGNASYLRQDISRDLFLLQKHIKHIHIKDKDSKGNNVLLGTGLCDFESFFQHPTIMEYNKIFTFETIAGEDPIRAASSNLNFISRYLS